MTSYAAEVQTVGDRNKNWNGNLCRFATRDEAQRYAEDLQWRWLQVEAIRVVESSDPVNYQWTSEGALRLEEKRDEA